MVMEPQITLVVVLFFSHSVVFNSLQSYGLCPPGSSVHGIHSGKNTGEGCHFLLQRIFATQGSNLYLLSWQACSLPLSYLGSPVLIMPTVKLSNSIHPHCIYLPPPKLGSLLSVSILLLSLFTFMHWRRKWQPTPVLLPGKSHGWWSLVGYSPWGRKESDTTEWLHFLS